MPQPDDPFGLEPLPNTIWNDEFRGLGGVNLDEMLSRQAAMQAEEQARLQEQYAADAAQAQERQYAEAEQRFIDWPTFQFLANEDPEVAAQGHDVYDGYLSALARQLQDMGYSQAEVAEGVAQFQQSVPRPAKPARDEGLLGNLWDSLKGGFQSGTRASQAFASADDVEELARLAAESAGTDRNAALQRFQNAVAPEGSGSDDWWTIIKRVGSAGVNDPEGMANFFAEQLAQSYPALAGAAAGAFSGSVAGPAGTLAGAAMGGAAGSGALDVGSTILDSLVQEARQRGIDPNNRDALVALLRDEQVRQRVIQGGIDHGIPVAVMDGASIALSGGLGRLAGSMLRAGRRAAPAAVAVGGLGAEAGLGAGGEALGQINQSGSITDRTGVVLEAAGELGPGLVTMGAGALTSPLRRGPATTPTPTPPVEDDFNEGDLPGAAAPQLLLPSTPQPIFVDEAGIASADAAAVVREAERRAAEAARATNPLFDALDRVNPDWREGTPDAPAEEEVALDMNDAEAIRAKLQEEGVMFRGFEAQMLVDLIANAPDDSKREAIAEAIDGLALSQARDAEPMSLALLQLAASLPRVPVDADAAVEQLTIRPGQSLLETIRTATGQRTKEDRKAETQAWVDHFLALPRDLAGEQARREAIADQAWQQVLEQERVEAINALPNNGPVDQAYLESSQQRLDRVVERLGRRSPTSRAKLQALRERAGLLLEETIDAHNRGANVVPAAGRGGAGAGRSGGDGAGGGAAGGLTRGGRSSPASAITPLQYRYLNTAGRNAVDTSIGARNIAENLGVAPEDVVPLITEALARGIVVDLTERGAERGLETAIRRPSRGALGTNLTPARSSGYNDPTLERAASRELEGRQRRPGNVLRRGLRPGEQIPTSDIVAGFRGLVEDAGNTQEAEGQPGGGVRAGVAEEGSVPGGPLRRGPGSVGPAGEAGVGEQPNNPQGNTGVPRLVRGRGYVQDDINRGGRPRDGLRQVNADVRLIEQQLVKEDKLRRAAERATAKSKSEKLSLKRAEREQRKALSLLARTASEEKGGVVTPEGRIDALKAAYEKTYPDHNYDDDVNEIFDANAEGVDIPGIELSDAGRPNVQGSLSPSALRTLQMSPVNSVLDYLSSVMPSPLARLVARQLQTLGLTVQIKLESLPGTERGRYTYDPLRNTEIVTIDPAKATLNTVLHELVHAATAAALRSPRNAKQRAAAAQMEKLYQYVLEQMPNSTQYGLTNVDEFVAEALANPAFQKDLAALQLPGESAFGIRNALDAFKRLVLRLLSVDKSNTVLSETILAASDLFGNLKGDNAVQLAEKAQNSGAPRTAIVGTSNGVRTHIAYAKENGFTLYTTSAAEPRGVKGTAIPKLTRAQTEKLIRDAGSEVLPPTADTRAVAGTPKNSDKKLVGFAPNGELRVAAFEQKDGTWTYYESDTDVRTDPDAKVYKNLSKDQAQRYLAATATQPVAPKLGTVKTAGETPTTIGYTPPKDWTVTWQNAEAALQYSMADALDSTNVPEALRVDQAAILRNTRAEQKIAEVVKQYWEPARKAGETISKDFNTTQAMIENIMRQLHVKERADVKIQQIGRGDMDAVTRAKAITKQEQAKKDADTFLRGVGNPQLIAAIKENLAPKMKALADNTLDMQAQYGLMTREDVETIKATYDFYVPLQTGERSTTGKAATGASTTGDVSFARLQEQSLRTIMRGEQNRVREMVMDLAEQYGLTNTVTGKPVVTVGRLPKMKYNKETNAIDMGFDSGTFDPNSMAVWKQGVPYRMTINDDAMLQALHPYKGEQRKTAGTVLIAVASWMNHMISIGKTALSPAFAPFNAFRDAGTAMLNMQSGVSRVEFMKQIVNPETWTSSFRNSFADAFGKDMTGRFAQANKAGSFISQRAYIGLEVLADSIDAAFAPTFKQKLKRRSQGSFKILTAWSQSMESATRYAVYKAAKNSGLSDQQAGVAAKTASVNFEARGLKNLSPVYIFANAKLQGLSALNRTITKNGGYTSPKVATGALALVGLGLMAGFVGYELSEKDKDGKSKYAKIPDYKKDSLVVFMEGVPGVPIPQEIAPFYVLGNSVADLWYGGKTVGEAASRMFTSLAAMLPASVPQQEIAGHKARPVDFLLRSITPSQFQPVLDIATNRNTFGSEVVSGLDRKKAQGMPGYAMGSAQENTLAVNRTKTLQSYGFEPETAERIANPAKGLHDMTGGTVDAAPQQLRAINAFFNPFAESFAFIRDIAGLREEKYVGDVVNPIARRFTPNATGFYDQDQFDALLAKAKQAQYQATQRGVDNLSREEQALAKSAVMLTRVQSDANALFRDSKTLSREQVAARQERQRELLLDGIRRYNELRDRMPRN